MTDPSHLLDVARRAAAAAAEVHREGSRRVDPSRWGEKGRSDFVTEVDLESERRIVEAIRSAFPTHAIIGEEGGEHARSEDPPGQPAAAPASPASPAAAAPAPVRWIIDPLDGTTNWLHGYPEYAVSIAAADRDGLVAGVVLNSATGELFEATRGGGARLDGAPIEVSSLEELRLALVGTGFPFKRLHILPAYLETFSTVLRATAGIRRAGSAALDLCDVACGRLDAFFEFHLMPWDVAAGGLIVREAGGRFEPLAVPGLEDEAEGDAEAGHGHDADPSLAFLPTGGFVAGAPGVWEAFRALLPGAPP